MASTRLLCRPGISCSCDDGAAYLKGVVVLRCSACNNAGWIGERKSVPAAAYKRAAPMAMEAASAWARGDEAGAAAFGGLSTPWANATGQLLYIMPRVAADQKPTTSRLQMLIERVIVDCRFFTLFAVAGSLLGSVLCFVEGSFLILKSYYFGYVHSIMSQTLDHGNSLQLIIEAIDMFLVGTAMLIFGMGLYSMFVGRKERRPESNLLGLFHLKMVPSWLEMRSMAQAKTLIGHAVLMILLVGVLEKFNSIPLVTCLDLACFAAAVLISSACIFLLSKLSAQAKI
ncbi:hypothetical protein Dimus_025601 [Dionaea muscipula]